MNSDLSQKDSFISWAALSMGLVRFLLAVAVVLAHTGGLFYGVTGPLAVKAFYTISGFLIAHIIHENRYPDARDFYASRFLRLWPVYIVTVFLALVWRLSNDIDFIPSFLSIPASAQAFLILTQSFLIGQDVVMFSGVNNSILGFVTNFQESTPPLHTLLIIPQAWSLGVELWFYLLAPFILKNRWRLITFFVLSLAARFAASFWWPFTAHDPWTYRFFPFELSLFLLGAIVRQYFYPLLLRHSFLTKRSSLAVTTATILFLLLQQALPFSKNAFYETNGFAILFALGLPFLFSFQGHFQKDRLIGELSYPVYITHILVKDIVEKSWPDASLAGWSLAAVTLTGSLLLSALLIYAVANPVDAYRRRLKKTPRSFVKKRIFNEHISKN